MQTPIQAAGLPWFEEDDYDSFRTVLPDRAWHPSFREWEAAAQQTLQHLEHQGIRAVKAHVQSAAFVAWCQRTGRNVDTHALTAFANDIALRSVTGQH